MAFRKQKPPLYEALESAILLQKEVFYWQKTHNPGTRSGQMSVCKLSALSLVI